LELRLVATGDGGISEMRDELNANKIMYGFCRVRDPNTGLDKFLLLHWQGETAPANRKGVCATHIADVRAYFRGAHITINARNEDEVSRLHSARVINFFLFCLNFVFDCTKQDCN
jgi:hypothetical protein